jgi:hypothetical protein
MISIASDYSWVHRMWTVLEKSDPLNVGMEAGVGEMVMAPGSGMQKQCSGRPSQSLGLLFN